MIDGVLYMTCFYSTAFRKNARTNAHQKYLSKTSQKKKKSYGKMYVQHTAGRIQHSASLKIKRTRCAHVQNIKN